MTLNLKLNGNIVSVIIFGEIEDKNETKKFTDTLDLFKHEELHLFFMDACMIPAEIIDYLFALHSNKRCRLNVFKRYLYSYFYSLGLPSRYTANNKYTAISEKKLINRDEVIEFLEEIYSFYGYDYREYQMDSIMRRIKLAMVRENLENFQQFKENVFHSSDSFEKLFLDLSINTTEFFRDPEVFLFIKTKVLPYLNTYPYIKIWCAGCSIGKEVYSLAILLQEFGILHKSQIYATDINPYVIEEAKNGLYSIKNIEKDIMNYRKSGGSRSFTEYFKFNKEYISVKNELKQHILFFQHSLGGTAVLNEFQLILCRNVMIYFESSLQQKVLKNFFDSLSTNGFLVLGKSEGLLKNNGYTYYDKYDEGNRVFKKK